MKQFLLTVAGVFVGLMLFMVVVPLALIAVAVGASRPTPLPAKSVLTLDLRSGLTDQEPQDGLPIFSPHGLSVMGVEETLRRAAGDGQVAGVFVRLPEGGVPPADADELRLAFQAFRASGKPMLAFSQGIYPEGVATATYELGAASGDLWMQPSATFQATGLAQQDIFLKRFFDKYGVVAELPAALPVQECGERLPLRRLHAGAPRGRALVDELGLRHQRSPRRPATASSRPTR